MWMVHPELRPLQPFLPNKSGTVPALSLLNLNLDSLPHFGSVLCQLTFLCILGATQTQPGGSTLSSVDKFLEKRKKLTFIGPSGEHHQGILGPNNARLAPNSLLKPVRSGVDSLLVLSDYRAVEDFCSTTKSPRCRAMYWSYIQA
jgi:hypothetical protein